VTDQNTNESTPAENAEETTNAETEQKPANTDPAEGEENTEGNESEENEAGDELPDWAREKLTKANSEAANYRTKLREAEEKLKNVKTLEEVDTLLAEFQAQREAEDAEKAKVQHELLIENIALKYKLPAKLAKRLQGSTREEIEADAKELASDFAEEAEPEHLEGGLTPRVRDEDADSDPRELARKYGRGSKRR
jgi:hypothetical protein